MRTMALTAGTAGLSFGMAITGGRSAFAATPGFHCPVAEIIETKCLGPRDCLYANASPRTFIQCVISPDGVSGHPVVMPCPSDLWWNDRQKVCDWPSQAKGSAQTQLTTSVGLGLVGPSGLSAHLELPVGPLPVPDRTITFTGRDGNTLCTVTTDANGDASCRVPMGLLEPYTVTFGGYDNESSSTATGAEI
jgi:hypothetical protein